MPVSIFLLLALCSVSSTYFFLTMIKSGKYILERFVVFIMSSHRVLHNVTSFVRTCSLTNYWYNFGFIHVSLHFADMSGFEPTNENASLISELPLSRRVIFSSRIQKLARIFHLDNDRICVVKTFSSGAIKRLFHK